MFHKGKHDREKQLRFSIRKVSFGAASVAVAALFMFLGNGAVSAAEQGVPSTNGETQAPQPKEPNAQNGTYEGNTVATSPAATVETNTQPSTVENSPSPESAPQKVETLDKKELTDLIKEIDGKFAKGTYATKTEESVNNLRAVLEEARTDLSTATTKTELTAAYRKLITATSKLQTKSEKKKEQAVDNTSDKGSKSPKNASAEKPLESNSIANSGSRDERNGKALDTNNPFRTGTDAAPSTSASTDPLAANATNVAIVNGNFNDTSQGAELPTATSAPITVKNDIGKLTGWKPVNSTTTTVPLIWTTKASQYGDSFPGDKGSRIGVVLAVYPGRGSGSGSPKPEFGPIYQDIDVVGGQEVKVTWRGTTVNINGGNNGAKLVVKNPETGAVLGQYARGYSGTPMGEMSVLVNVPEGLKKLRLQFETALNRSTENHTYDSSYNKPAISSDENAGGVVSNVRVASGSYLVSEVVNTTYESTATSATSTTVDTTVTVKVINKGFSTSTNNQYRVELPEGATLVGTTGTSSSQLNGTSLTLDFKNLDPKREQTLTYTFSLPTTKPIEKNLEGTVSYQTSGNLIDNGTKKTGSDTVAQQTVKINMYKADLQAEATKAATLNQSDYTPEAWAAYQAEVAKAQAILNEETNNVEVANRKNQADINAQTLLLQKAQAKLEIDKAKKAKLAAIEGTPNATKEEKDAAKQAAQDAATKADKA
ncbi:MAG: YSIRK-type signal peptide-containing protein, partial [Streptococcus mitis]|nr:YSIRK-type signal peptide-containing protein [Streptococcus mitis]